MKNTMTINSNELLDVNPELRLGYSHWDYLKSQIKYSILQDYKKGVRTARISVIPSDYYDGNGNKVIDWQNGDMFKIGDILNCLNDNNEPYLRDENNNVVYWQIKDRKIRYEGQVIIDLVLQEIII